MSFGNVRMEDAFLYIWFVMESLTAVMSQMKRTVSTGPVSMGSSSVLTRWNVSRCNEFVWMQWTQVHKLLDVHVILQTLIFVRCKMCVQMMDLTVKMDLMSCVMIAVCPKHFMEDSPWKSATSYSIDWVSFAMTDRVLNRNNIHNCCRNVWKTLENAFLCSGTVMAKLTVLKDQMSWIVIVQPSTWWVSCLIQLIQCVVHPAGFVWEHIRSATTVSTTWNMTAGFFGTKTLVQVIK